MIVVAPCSRILPDATVVWQKILRYAPLHSNLALPYLASISSCHLLTSHLTAISCRSLQNVVANVSLRHVTFDVTPVLHHRAVAMWPCVVTLLCSNLLLCPSSCRQRSKAGVPVEGRCAWSAVFRPLLEGTFTFKATIINWRGGREVHREMQVVTSVLQCSDTVRYCCAATQKFAHVCKLRFSWCRRTSITASMV